MAEEKPDYAAQFINHIRAKIAALQAVLASVESAMALGALGQPIEGADAALPTVAARNDALEVPSDLPEGAFLGKSVAACIELYLSAAKKKKTNKEIAAALQEGGVESNARTFASVVTGSLFDLKKAGKVLRFKDGWGLASWYPAHIRAAIPAASTKPAKRKGKGARAKAKAKGSEVKVVSEQNVAPTPAATAEKKKGATAERICQMLRSKPSAEFTAEQVAAEMDLNVQVVRMVLATLVKYGKADKTESGNYRSPITTNQPTHHAVM